MEHPSTLRRSEISTKAQEAQDLAGRYPTILADIVQKTQFVPEKDPFSLSTWWGKKIGAVHYRGTLPVDGKEVPAVLKIEGVKMEPDEATETHMILKAQDALRGSGIRPPKIFQEIPWTEENGGYSAVFLEDVYGKPILPLPATQEQIHEFLAIRDRYRQAFIDNKVVPWIVAEDDLPTAVRKSFAKWQETSGQLFPNHPFRKPEDGVLIQDAINTLVKAYEGVEPEFQHGHFSHRDVVKQNDEIIMFSNLYWSYRIPLYDLVFGYHWYMIELASKPETTKEDLQKQQAFWDNEFANRMQSMTPEEKNLFRLARIERLAAALTIDGILASSDGSSPVAGEMVGIMRKQLKDFLTS